jgi:hypothetical protein
MPPQEHRQNSGLVIIALALAGVLYLGQIFHVRWGVLLPKMAAAAVTEQVKDQDVYAVTSDGNKKKYWKNGVKTRAFNIDGSEWGSDLHIRGDIYRTVLGYSTNGKFTIIEKNGSTLYYLFDAHAIGVFVSGDDVYASGYEQNSHGKKVAAVWKNGRLLYRLTNGNFGAEASSLYVSGGDVYAGGYESNSQGNCVATVWKNGKELYRLTNGNFYAHVFSLYVSGGDVYAAGTEITPQGKYGKDVATVWKNGAVLYRLDDKDAHLVFVR